jgi:hypothetical protein
MSLERTRSRIEETRETDKGKERLEKRLREARAPAEDKAVISGLGRELNMEGTSEGMRAVEKSVRDGAEIADREFREQKAQIEREEFDTARERERGLEQKVQALDEDLTAVSRSIAELKEAIDKGSIEKAGEEAKEDRKFVDDVKKAQERVRTGGESEVEKLTQQVDSTEVSFEN